MEHLGNAVDGSEIREKRTWDVSNWVTGWERTKKTYGPERGKILEILFNGRNPANDV